MPQEHNGENLTPPPIAFLIGHIRLIKCDDSVLSFENRHEPGIAGLGNLQKPMTMKTKFGTSIAAIFAAVFVLSANAQITPRPPSWTGTNALNAFGSNLVSPADQAAFHATGLNLDDSSVPPVLPPQFVGPAAASAWFNPLGGSVKVIFLGETSGWQNDFGYVVKPAVLSNPAVYNPLVVNYTASPYGTAPAPGLLIDNTYTNVSYGAGQTLDFFVNGVGSPGNPGGTWFAFGDPNQFASGDTDIQTKYWSTTINGVSTLFVGFEDNNNLLDNFQSHDYTDFIVAFQGVSAPVPEPSTYGLLAAIALLGVIMMRRFQRTAPNTV